MNPDVRPALIDRTLSGGCHFLHFPPVLEAAFEQEIGAERCRQFMRRGLAALVLYNLLLFSDMVLVPDVLADAALVRLGIITPLGLAVLLILRMNPRPMVREGVGAIMTVVTAASIVAIARMSESPYRFDAEHAVVLCIIFATVVQRLRFWYAAATSAGCYLIYNEGLWAVPDLAAVQVLSAQMTLGGVVVLALIGSYNLEREQRLGYLMALRERLRATELEGLTRHDSLTGLLNRRALDQSLATIVEDKRHRHTAVLLLDIDHFKLFNDAVGHQEGDSCIQAVSRLLSSVLRGRPSEAFRYGGEEFLVLLPDSDLRTASAVAERIRRAVDGARMRHPGFGDSRVVTVSVGCAAGQISSLDIARAVIADADAALYRAKHNGRNQVFPSIPALVECDLVEFRDPPKPFAAAANG